MSVLAAVAKASLDDADVVSSAGLPDRLLSILASDACADDGRLDTFFPTLEPSSSEDGLESELELSVLLSSAVKTLRASWAAINRVEERAVTMA